MADGMKRAVALDDGFPLEVDADALDDAELFELMMDIDAGKSANFVPILRAMLGEDGKKALYDHLRGEDGRVRLSAVAGAVTEIFAAMQDKKK